MLNHVLRKVFIRGVCGYEGEKFRHFLYMPARAFHNGQVSSKSSSFVYSSFLILYCNNQEEETPYEQTKKIFL